MKKAILGKILGKNFALRRRIGITKISVFCKFNDSGISGYLDMNREVLQGHPRTARWDYLRRQRMV